jgi:hypothetical protein
MDVGIKLISSLLLSMHASALHVLLKITKGLQLELGMYCHVLSYTLWNFCQYLQYKYKECVYVK